MTLYTPKAKFGLNNSTQFANSLELGKRVSSKKKIIIASLLRDTSSRMKLIRKKVESLGELFLDYRVLIVENDSVDQTRNNLLRWSKENPKIIVLGCGVGAKKCEMKEEKTTTHSIDHSDKLRKRINKMSKLRNIYLEYIKNNFDPEEYEYVALWDLDVIGSTYLDGVMNGIGEMELNPELSVMCANGVYKWSVVNFFYDTFALVEKGGEKGISSNIHTGLIGHQHTPGDPLVPVKSCFSGFALYRSKDLCDPKTNYFGPNSREVECEHTLLHSTIKGNKVINPGMINYVLHNPL